MLATLSLLAAGPAQAVEPVDWPADSGWTPLQCADQSAIMFDAQGDEAGAPFERDLVGSAKMPAGFFAEGDSALFVRLRLDRTPDGTQGRSPFTWQALIDTDGNRLTYEVALRADADQDEIGLSLNPSGGGDDFRDDPDAPVVFESLSFTQVSRVVDAVDSTFGGDGDVFLDISLSSDALGTVGIYDGDQFAIISLGTSSMATGRLDGDIVCDADPNQGSGGTGTGMTGDTGAPPVETGDDTGGEDTGSSIGTVLLSGAGGCSTTPVGWAPWLVVVGLFLPRRNRRA
ncbi:MAG: hypothetical protein AAF602_09280 [Myxococcota bacterium]